MYVFPPTGRGAVLHVADVLGRRRLPHGETNVLHLLLRKACILSISSSPKVTNSPPFNFSDGDAPNELYVNESTLIGFTPRKFRSFSVDSDHRC